MLSSITPLGERGRRRSWGPTVAALLTGSVLGGAAVGAAAGLLGSAVPAAARPGPAAAAAVVCVLAALGGACDAHLGGLGLPTVRRQVNEDWLPRYRGWAVGLGYGAQLGAAVVTIVPTAAVYLALALALLSASPVGGMAVGATFGLARALPVLAMRSVTTPARLARAHERLEAWAPLAARSTAGAQGLLAAAVLAWGVGR